MTDIDREVARAARALDRMGKIAGPWPERARALVAELQEQWDHVKHAEQSVRSLCHVIVSCEKEFKNSVPVRLVEEQRL